MPEHTTLLRPAAPSPGSGHRISSAFPPDVLDAVRGRVRLLSGLLFVAFAFDLVVYAGNWIAVLSGVEATEGLAESGGFQFINLAAAAASFGIWWAAGSRRVSAQSLHTIGLAYEVVICFTIATIAFWQYYVVNQRLPNLTWVPMVVILFPLIMPGPPRRMLAAAVTAGAMSPLALLLLQAAGKVTATADAYVQATVHSAFAVAFAYSGAKLIYGLGREVAAAREYGSYRLVELLGQGGMGEVWRARHHLLARRAAIKLIRPEALGDQQTRRVALARFEQEAQATASLRSPHTIDLYDFGISDTGVFYYVMELLVGRDMQTLVRDFGQLPPERVLYLLEQVCESLAEAHVAGLVHRDIKPSNIYVCREGLRYDFVKVLDFGLARDRRPEAVRLTMNTSVRLTGTPAYMAPEVILGATEVDPRADIYALGCVAYFLLTGQLVFEGTTPMKTLLKHVEEAPVPPSQRTEVAVPPALDALILACLEKDPDRRPKDAQAVLHLVRECRVGTLWNDDRAREWWVMHLPELSAPSPT